MPYYVRAINRENWPEPDDNANVHDLCADALNDLKTSENVLSVWYAESKEELNDALLAYLASMDKWISYEEVEYIAISDEDIRESGIEVKDEPNPTYITDYEYKHRELTGLNYDRIEQIAGIMIKSIDKRQDYVVSTSDIRLLFKKVIQDGLINSEKIDKKNHGKFRRYIKEIESEFQTNIE